MLLWKSECSPASIGGNDPRTRDGVPKPYETKDGKGLPPWFFWPRPPGGFIDLGCVCSVEKRIFRKLISWSNFSELNSFDSTLITPLPRFFSKPLQQIPMSALRVQCPMSFVLTPLRGDNDAAVGMVSSCISSCLRDTRVSELMFERERRGRIIPLQPGVTCMSKHWILPSLSRVQIQR